METIGIVAAASVALYAVSYLLAHKKVLHIAVHRKIWNAVLALSFVAVAATSIGYVLGTGFGIRLPYDVSPLHSLSGTVFVIVGIFHALWHIPYFKACIPQGKKG